MNKNYTISLASREHFENLTFTTSEDRDAAFGYVATVDSRVVGRIVILPREKYEYGMSWFVRNLRVEPEFRRQGIATALVEAVKRRALEEGVIDLYGSANQTVAASRFWLSQGFAVAPYGKPDGDGNFLHWICCRLERERLERSYRYELAELERGSFAEWLRGLTDAGKVDAKPGEYVLTHIDGISGFVCHGESGEIIGAGWYFVDDLKPPLDEKYLFSYVYVDEAHRLRGLGRELVAALAEEARRLGVLELNRFASDDAELGFWFRLGFGIIRCGVTAETGKRGMRAMIRV